MLKDHKVIVFGVEHYTELVTIRSLGRAGILPDVIAVPGRVPVASCSKYAAKVHFVDTVEEGYHVLLKEYGRGTNLNNLPVIYCGDDRTMGYLDNHYDEIKDKFILFSAYEQGRISAYMDKFNILECAKKNGLNVLETKKCKRGEIPEGIEYPIITKSISPNVGGWKSDVHICRSEEELKNAYEQIQADTVLLQKYIEKKNELCLDGFTIDHGKKLFIPQASTYNYLISGYYSPYMTSFNFRDTEIYKALQGVFSDIGFDGIFSVEFLIGQDDQLYFSEINFRVSSWCWVSTMFDMNLPVLWGEAMLTGEIPSDACKQFPENCTSMVEPIDYGKRVDAGKITPAQWLADFKDAAVTYYYDKEDPAPYYVMMENWERLK